MKMHQNNSGLQNGLYVLIHNVMRRQTLGTAAVFRIINRFYTLVI